MKVLQNECLRRATKLADWFVFGQVKDGNNANCGRYVFTLQEKPPFREWTTNWTTGMSCIAVLMAWQRTKDEKYLKSAKLSGEYMKSLQVLDRRNPAALGLFRECTPQSNMCHPRDALSAAWGLLHLYLETKEADCLYRVRLFAEWFRKHAMRKGYPAWTAYVEKTQGPYWQLGSFHGGSPLFFFDLYKVTKERKWLELGLTICDTWIKTFQKSDGSIRIEVDPKTGKDLTGSGPAEWHIGWQEMHKWNDDFTTLALLRAYSQSKNKRYLNAAGQYLDWAVGEQNPDGSFGKPPVNSAAPTLILELLDLARITGKAKYKKAALASVPHFFGLQELKNKEPRFHGGFYCIHGPYVHNSRVALGARTSAYALAALLRLENKRSYVGYRA
jgi:rhamnogalacturonyl hydrolase YesR